MQRFRGAFLIALLASCLVLPGGGVEAELRSGPADLEAVSCVGDCEWEEPDALHLRQLRSALLQQEDRGGEEAGGSSAQVAGDGESTDLAWLSSREGHRAVSAALAEAAAAAAADSAELGRAAAHAAALALREAGSGGGPFPAVQAVVAAHAAAGTHAAALGRRAVAAAAGALRRSAGGHDAAKGAELIATRHADDPNFNWNWLNPVYAARAAAENAGKQVAARAAQSAADAWDDEVGDDWYYLLSEGEKWDRWDWNALNPLPGARAAAQKTADDVINGAAKSASDAWDQTVGYYLLQEVRRRSRG